MATVQITTWEEFKTALTETITENTTYEIMNDIDASGEILQSTISIPTSQFIRTYNGNSHAINGITSYANITGAISHNAYSASGVSGYDVIFNDIHFSNIQLSDTNGGFFYCGSRAASSTYRSTQFNGCLFSGQTRYWQYNYDGSYYTYAYYNNCSFNMEVISNGGVGHDDAHFNNCYIIVSYLRPITSRFAPEFNNLTNCYIGGHITIGYNSSGSSYSICRTLYNSVFNMDVDITITSGNVYIIGTYSSAYYGLLNIGKITSAGATVPDVTNVYKLTDSQMKSKTYIHENTNFPLYG